MRQRGSFFFSASELLGNLCAVSWELRGFRELHMFVIKLHVQLYLNYTCTWNQRLGHTMQRCVRLLTARQSHESRDEFRPGMKKKKTVCFHLGIVPPELNSSRPCLRKHCSRMELSSREGHLHGNWSSSFIRGCQLIPVPDTEVRSFRGESRPGTKTLM